MKTALFALAVAFLGFRAVATQEFDFKDPKGVNSVTWLMDSPIEPISGKASEISGTFTLNPEHPEKSRGTVIIQAKSLLAPVPLMTQHLLSKDWMNVAKFPTITFKLKRIELGDVIDEHQAAIVTGDLTMHGITKQIEAPVEVRLGCV